MYLVYTSCTNSHLEDFRGFDDIIGLQFAVNERGNAKNSLCIKVNFRLISPKTCIDPL